MSTSTTATNYASYNKRYGRYNAARATGAATQYDAPAATSASLYEAAASAGVPARSQKSPKGQYKGSLPGTCPAGMYFRGGHRRATGGVHPWLGGTRVFAGSNVSPTCARRPGRSDWNNFVAGAASQDDGSAYGHKLSAAELAYLSKNGGLEGAGYQPIDRQAYARRQEYARTHPKKRGPKSYDAQGFIVRG